MDKKPVYTVGEIADYYRVTPAAVYKWIKTGKLEAFQLGDAYRITADALERFVSHSRVIPTEELAA